MKKLLFFLKNYYNFIYYHYNKENEEYKTTPFRRRFTKIDFIAIILIKCIILPFFGGIIIDKLGVRISILSFSSLLLIG